MRRVSVALALATLIPISAGADPITVNLQSSTGGFSSQGDAAGTGPRMIDLGELFLPGGDATGTFFFSGLNRSSNYVISFQLPGTLNFEGLRMEVLDPLGDGDDRADMAQPAGLPEGFSTSNDADGFSFAQDSALERSATFAGGSATMTADEHTHRGDILLFSGLNGAEDARVLFGLRDRVGGRDFLVRISAIGGLDSADAPEPASLLLLGSGLATLVAARRRRRTAI